MLRTIYDLLPSAARHGLKWALSTAGHGASWLDSAKARDHASSKKRLDNVARLMAEKFKSAGLRSLEGRSCLEFGAGYTPSELLVYHLLGASELWAADYNAIARLDVLRQSLRDADGAATVASLSEFARREDLEARFARLRGMSSAEFHRFVEGSMTYLAPFDATIAPLPRTFDWINSTSVLEHISPDRMRPVLSTLAAGLAPGGMMMHHVDLKDHWDLHRDPLRFMRDGDRFDPQRDADSRGNGWRKSDYLACFRDIEDVDTRVVAEGHVALSHLPAKLKSKFRGRSEDELLGGEIVIVCVKRRASPRGTASAMGTRS